MLLISSRPTQTMSEQSNQYHNNKSTTTTLTFGPFLSQFPTLSLYLPFHFFLFSPISTPSTKLRTHFLLSSVSHTPYLNPFKIPGTNQMSSSNPPRGCCSRCCSSLISLGLLILIYWLIFQPHQIRVYMNSATLSNFSLSDATLTSLSYNIALNISLRNPNRKIGIYYDRLSAEAFYDGSQLGSTESNFFDPFFQHTKTTHMVYPVFQGSQGNLSKDVKDAFNKDKNDGAYNLDVKLNAKVRHKVWFIKLSFRPKIDCWLKFPLVANGNATVAAQPTKCRVKY
ncbi:hypothetical protein LUZ61_007313 [Rhynchospora tenuis]|uniref:Late embryogenesis abundant protein LEA-2 subgroup domain-containing protein n=1 Tax=Rhynchospora tenuis TaxID=198213 RepID=A0AAD5ZTC1_9POAL|nr:hypothetical protein LUZ61_007313 [Rhynchospora tenuis]